MRRCDVCKVLKPDLRQVGSLGYRAFRLNCGLLSDAKADRVFITSEDRPTFPFDAA